MPKQVVARTSAKALQNALPPWASALRLQVRSVAGQGWQVAEQSGRVKVSLRYQGGTRASAMLPMPWTPASVPQVLSAVAGAAEGVRSGLPLATAVRRLGLVHTGGAPARGTADWAALGEAYRAWATGAGVVAATTWPGYARVLRALVGANPSTVEDALQAVATGAPGSRGRQVRVQTAARLLRWAVEHHRLPERWTPPARMTPWVGRRVGPAPEGTRPRSDEELLALLEAAQGDRLWSALATLAVLGLRPAELRHLRWEPDGTAKVLAGKTGARVVVPLPLPGLDLARIRAAQLPRLPKADALVSLRLSDTLRTKPWWDETWKLYSLRHSWADRAHRLGILPKDAAALMGHSLRQHLLTYQRQGPADDAVARVRAALKGSPLTLSTNLGKATEPAATGDLATWCAHHGVELVEGEG